MKTYRLGRMVQIVAALALLGVAACTSSGPFVTSISSDGAGGLTIESCASTYNALMGTQGNGDCATSHIQLSQSSR